MAARERESQEALQARKRNRRMLGKRALLSQDPLLDSESAYLGVPTQTSLGSGGFSRKKTGETV